MLRIRHRDRDSVFSAGRVRRCATASYLHSEALFGRGSAARRRQESCPAPALLQSPALTSARVKSRSLPSCGGALPTPGWEGLPPLEVRGDGAWPAVRSRDSLGITGGALFSLQSALPAGAPARAVAGCFSHWADLGWSWEKLVSTIKAEELDSVSSRSARCWKASFSRWRFGENVGSQHSVE